MTATGAALAPEALHPALWRASQLARSRTRCFDTGYPSLSNQLPGGGWPSGSLIELLMRNPGIGELRLLSPALGEVAEKRIVMIQPPHPPQAIAMTALGIQPSNLIWLRPESSGDALWATEQVLRSGSCGALLLWQKQIRPENLRRLQVSAQHGETLFWLMRPLEAAMDSSSAPLRLTLKPALGGVEVGFVKRQGPRRDESLFLPMSIGLPRHVRLRPAPQRSTAMPTALQSHSANLIQ